jgi:hypothetical protein
VIVEALVGGNEPASDQRSQDFVQLDLLTSTLCLCSRERSEKLRPQSEYGQTYGLLPVLQYKSVSMMHWEIESVCRLTHCVLWCLSREAF